jgi:hypothetical protein
MLVKFTARARRQTLHHGAKWIIESHDAPGLFDEELDVAIALLGHTPHAGRRVQGRRLAPGARVLVLQKTKFLVFYRLVRKSYVSILGLRPGRMEPVIDTTPPPRRPRR